MRIETDPKLDFNDVLIKPKRSTLTSRQEVDLTRTYLFKHGGRFNGIPIVAANMDHTGTIEMANALSNHNMSTALHKHYNKEDLIQFFSSPIGSNHFYSIGMMKDNLDKYNAVKEHCHLPYVCIDVANGYTEAFINFVASFRNDNPTTVIMAGNVVTADVTEQLLLAGADIVKIGIGQGSVCTTRKKTGIGYPQLSAIIECADAAHGLGGHICADGGCVNPGDVAKAFGAGADFVMLGGMLAGHDECGGEVVFQDMNSRTVPTSKQNADETNSLMYYDLEHNTFYAKHGQSWDEIIHNEIPTHMKFYGMSSKTAMDKHVGGVANYRASEGKEVLVPYRGSVNNAALEILGGVRSACTYTGSKSLKELPKRTTFVLVNKTHNTVFGDE